MDHELKTEFQCAKELESKLAGACMWFSCWKVINFVIRIEVTSSILEYNNHMCSIVTPEGIIAVPSMCMLSQDKSAT